jgi:hypothetical protein
LATTLHNRYQQYSHASNLPSVLQAWSDAVSMCMRFGQACDKANARSSQSKAYLGAIVVWLYAGDAQQAWQVRAGSSSSSSS